ncbi:MAG TPA: biopolymer transporter ExbD [Pseudobdellovibrionaceae bacterium]|nr:biopolymer transporter ExbD [Pseudobdellovibrionaceae bacterium]
MAQIESGRGGGRSKNVDLNLIPFIDLMSVLITFLLITAVWTQVSMIQLGTSFYSKKVEGVEPIKTPDMDISLRVDIKSSGYTIVFGQQYFSIPLKEKEFDTERFFSEMEKIKKQVPNKQDAVVAISNELPYEILIHSMDQLLRSGFPAISIAAGGPK